MILAFASLGLPGLAGIVAELQILVGAFSVYPWLAGIGLSGWCSSPRPSSETGDGLCSVLI